MNIPKNLGNILVLAGLSLFLLIILFPLGIVGLNSVKSQEEFTQTALFLACKICLGPNSGSRRKTRFLQPVVE